MLETTRQKPAALRPQAGACPNEPPPGVAALVARLRTLHVEPHLLPTARGVTAGGVALRVPVRQTLQCPAATERLLRSLATLLRDNIPLTISMQDLGADDAAITALEDFCTALRRVAPAGNASPGRLGLALQSHQMPLQAYLLISTALLGTGPRYVMLDSLQMRHHDDRRVQHETDNNWSFLWRRRTLTPAVAPAYAASVTTHCQLLGDEAATAILPQHGIQVPVDTAWLPLTLYLPDFSDGRGRLCWQLLQRTLRASVDLAEHILDHLCWPQAAQQADAWQNRRLAILLAGIGDLVVERGANPAELRCLQWIDRTVEHLHRLIWNRSRALARKAEPLPALLRTEPTAGWPNSSRKRDWHGRWRRALTNAAVRHRNLLVMSPYSVLPRGTRSVAEFIDLLPVLQHADAFSFANPPGEGYRNSQEFANFHRRAWAVMQRRNAASFVAAGA
jgi:hypothetical protein